MIEIPDTPSELDFVLTVLNDEYRDPDDNPCYEDYDYDNDY